MTISSTTNQIIGLARDYHSHFKKWLKRGSPQPTPARTWKEAIVADLTQCGYFDSVAVENFAEALILLMETSDPKRKPNEGS